MKTGKKRGIIKRFLPKTLFGRSLLILVAPIFLIQVISTYVFFDRHWDKMTRRLAYAVAGEVVLLADYIDDNGSDLDSIEYITDLTGKKLDLIASYEQGASLPSDDIEQRKRWRGWAFLIGNALTEELKKQTDRRFTVDIDFHEKWVEVRMQLKSGVLRISLPQRRLFSATTYIFLLWVYAVSLALLVIAVLFMRNQIRPIRRLAVAAERFGKGRDVRNFKLEGAKEVRQAGKAFLDMRTRIQRQISQRTAMLAGVSHDLRTPLTRMKLQLALLGDNQDIRDLRGDIEEMEKMIDGYLDFVRGEGDEKPVSTDIKDFLETAVADAKRDGCDIDLHVDENLDQVGFKGQKNMVMIRPLAFKRCLTNIIGNAKKYSSKIWVCLEYAEAKKLLITIEDNGIGIDEDQYDDVFRPFYRVDSSRNADTGGTGLGLPIAMDIVHAHGGVIWLEKSQKGGGLAVKIKLPI